MAHKSHNHEESELNKASVGTHAEQDIIEEVESGSGPHWTTDYSNSLTVDDTSTNQYSVSWKSVHENILSPVITLADPSTAIARDNSVTENPVTENPGTENPGTENPGTENPGTENPGTENPVTENPAVPNSAVSFSVPLTNRRMNPNDVFIVVNQIGSLLSNINGARGCLYPGRCLVHGVYEINTCNRPV